VVAMMACLGQPDLRAARLRSAAALAKAAFFLPRPDAERRVQLAGRAQMVVQPSDYYLSRLAVGTGERRRGFGRLLLSQFEAEGTERGFRRLALEVSADNTPAILLYESHGFTRVSVSRVVDDQSGRALEYVHMAKSLA
jgi:ribosomal protein S18 acetylase RimI-like enzyme